MNAVEMLRELRNAAKQLKAVEGVKFAQASTTRDPYDYGVACGLQLAADYIRRRAKRLSKRKP